MVGIGWVGIGRVESEVEEIEMGSRGRKVVAESAECSICKHEPDESVRTTIVID